MARLYVSTDRPIRDARFHMQLGRNYVVAIPASFECANPDVVYIKRKQNEELYAFCVVEAYICEADGSGELSHCFLALSDEVVRAALTYKVKHDTALSDMVLLLCGFKGDKRSDGFTYKPYAGSEVSDSILRDKGARFDKEKLTEHLFELFDIITREEYLDAIKKEEA